MQSGREQRELWSVLRKSGQEMANGIQARPWEREIRPWATTRPIRMKIPRARQRALYVGMKSNRWKER